MRVQVRQKEKRTVARPIRLEAEASAVQQYVLAAFCQGVLEVMFIVYAFVLTVLPLHLKADKLFVQMFQHIPNLLFYSGFPYPRFGELVNIVVKILISMET